METRGIIFVSFSVGVNGICEIVDRDVLSLAQFIIYPDILFEADSIRLFMGKLCGLVLDIVAESHRVSFCQKQKKGAGSDLLLCHFDNFTLYLWLVGDV
jgi:hypothetical protein